MHWQGRKTLGTWLRGDISFWLHTEDAIPFISPSNHHAHCTRYCKFGNPIAGLSTRLPHGQTVGCEWAASSHLLSAGPPDHTPPWSQPWHTHLTFALLLYRDGQVSSAFSIPLLPVCVCKTMVNYGNRALQTTISCSLHLLLTFAVKINISNIHFLQLSYKHI